MGGGGEGRGTPEGHHHLTDRPLHEGRMQLAHCHSLVLMPAGGAATPPPHAPRPLAVQLVLSLPPIPTHLQYAPTHTHAPCSSRFTPLTVRISWPSALHCHPCHTPCSPGNVPTPTPATLMDIPCIRTGQQIYSRFTPLQMFDFLYDSFPSCSCPRNSPRPALTPTSCPACSLKARASRPPGWTASSWHHAAASSSTSCPQNTKTACCSTLLFKRS